MRILLLHNRYQIVGGEDGVVQAEKSLLEANDHQVSLLEVSNEQITSTWDKISAALSVIYSHSAKQKVSEEISKFCPDVVHVHNFFPLLSPSVYDACREHKLPVVQTLHNYRLACAKAMFFRDRKICEDCIGKPIPLPSIIHGCYRNSRLQSSAVAAMITWHRLQDTWHSKVDAYIALTNFQKEKMVQAGLPSEKIYIKPNFVFDHNYSYSNNKNSDYLLFVGRLSEEKGVSVLIDAYINNNLDIPLKIVGDGPLRQALQERVEKLKLDNIITFLGKQDKQTVFKTMQNAKLLIVPSIWYEGCPLTIMEAFSCSLPVINSQIGSLAEIVEDGVTGLHFQTGNSLDLAEKIKWALTHPDAIADMGENAHSVYETQYIPEVNYQQLMEIYRQVINYE